MRQAENPYSSHRFVPTAESFAHRGAPNPFVIQLKSLEYRQRSGGALYCSFTSAERTILYNLLYTSGALHAEFTVAEILDTLDISGGESQVIEFSRKSPVDLGYTTEQTEAISTAISRLKKKLVQFYSSLELPENTYVPWINSADSQFYFCLVPYTHISQRKGLSLNKLIEYHLSAIPVGHDFLAEERKKDTLLSELCSKVGFYFTAAGISFAEGTVITLTPVQETLIAALLGSSSAKAAHASHHTVNSALLAAAERTVRGQEYYFPEVLAQELGAQCQNESVHAVNQHISTIRSLLAQAYKTIDLGIEYVPWIVTQGFGYSKSFCFCLVKSETVLEQVSRTSRINHYLPLYT